MTKPKDAARKAAERFAGQCLFRTCPYDAKSLARLLRAYGKREYSRGRTEMFAQMLEEQWRMASLSGINSVTKGKS